MKRVAIVALIMTALVFTINGVLQMIIGGKSFFFMTADILVLRIVMIAFLTAYVLNRKNFR